MTDLGPEWIPGPDGIPRRDAARVVLFDGRRRVLLVRGHDAHNPARSWWFTIGGGRTEGETAREGAVRELGEETGLILPPQDLVGPVLYRESLFRFSNVTARQDEFFFAAYLAQRDVQIDHSGLNAHETSVLDEFRWFTPDELEATARTTEVFPRALPRLVRAWAPGWDGVREEIREFDA